MKRKGILLLLAMLPALAFPASAAFASGAPELTTSAPTAYYLDDTMYAFALLPDYVPEDEFDAPQAGLMVNGVQVGEPAEGRKLTEAAGSAEYLLLVDCSGSMPRYQQQILALADGLLASGQDVSVTVAAFGDSFRVTEEHLRDAAAVRSALSRLQYSDQGTDICGGAAYAVDYMKNEAWETGGLSSVILITDGEAFYTNNPEIEAESEDAAAKTLRQIREESPQILLHTVCFAPEKWTDVTHDAVAGGAGLDLSAGGSDEAGTAGATIAAYYDSLYELEFPLQSYADDLALRLSPTDIYTIRHAHNLTAPPAESILDRLPEIIDSEGSPPEPEQTPEPTAEPPAPEIDRPEIGVTEPTEAPEETPPETSTEPEETPPVESPAAPETEEPAPFPEKPPQSGASPLLIGLIIGGGVLLALVVALLIVLLRKRGKTGAAPAAAAPAAIDPDAILLRLEIICGEVQGSKQQFALSDSLFIGSDARCDLVLPDPAVSPVNTRVFRRGGTVCIEDLNSAGGTALGGMRIYTPNQLRSGDEIMVGSACFRFYF